MNTTLTRDDVRVTILETLRDFLGAKAPQEITEKSDPFKDFGLDSEDGVDFACYLSEKFEMEFPEKENPFVDDLHQRARCVGETIDLVFKLLQNPSNE